MLWQVSPSFTFKGVPALLNSLAPLLGKAIGALCIIIVGGLILAGCLVMALHPDLPTKYHVFGWMASAFVAVAYGLFLSIIVKDLATVGRRALTKVHTP